MNWCNMAAAVSHRPTLCERRAGRLGDGFFVPAASPLEVTALTE